MGIIYKITNKINSKSYIGQTRNSLAKRMGVHKSEAKKKDNMPLYRAIRKYGWENFEYAVLEKGIPVCKLNEREIYFIDLYDTFHNGYNATTGGDTPLKISQESIRRSAEARKGLPAWNRGKHGIYSEEALQKMADAKARTWEVIYPDGHIEEIKNLQQFCRENNLTIQCMLRIPKGIQRQHKGFKCREIKKEEVSHS